MKNKNCIVSFIGSGNVATYLAHFFYFNGIQIKHVLSRDIKNAQKLAASCNAIAIDDFNILSDKTDFTIIATNDDAIEEITQNIVHKDTLFLHTSGSVNMDVFKTHLLNYGVLYPLQTFSKDHPLKHTNFPIFIEANKEENLLKIKELASVFSGEINCINSEERIKIHIAAVFVSNFTNHLFTLAEDMLEKQQMNFDLLEPLIQQVVQKSLEFKPKNSQTGPAYRNDIKTINKHLDMLKKDKDKNKIYQLISRLISENHTNNEEL